MKFRKSGMFAKRSVSGRSTAKLRTVRQTLRRGLVEKLEGREMMNADWNAALVGATGFFTGSAARQQVLSYVSTQGQSGSGGGGGLTSPEGDPTTTVNVSESSPTTLSVKLNRSR